MFLGNISRREYEDSRKGGSQLGSGEEAKKEGKEGGEKLEIGGVLEEKGEERNA
jgi:hypothetical protein